MSRIGLLGLLAALALLAGCTSDGYLGAVDEPAEGAQPEGAGDALWRPALSAHAASIVIAGAPLTLRGDLAPLELPSVSLSLADDRPFALGAPDAARDEGRFALRGATLDGERGWLVMDAGSGARLGGPQLRAAEGERIVLDGHAVRADATGVHAEVASGLDLVTPPPFGCWPDPSPDEDAACAEWRASHPPEPPASLGAFATAVFSGLRLPATLLVDAGGIVFYGADGEPRALQAPVTVGTARATLVALPAEPPFPSATLHIPLLEERSFAWKGDLTIEAGSPRGSVAFTDATRALDGHQRLSMRVRGADTATLSHTGSAWSLAPFRAETTDIVTDGVPRLGAALRMAPDSLEANGTAGEVTRVTLLLAETSRGASAHLTGYRLSPGVEGRYVGHEPFAMTEAILDAIDASPAPITPLMAMSFGIALPFVAILDGVASAFAALFPPSVAGELEPGGGRALTFELRIPEEARDVEILIEAANADPVRATVRLVPDA